MSALYRKTRKLFKNPTAFFLDSKFIPASAKKTIKQNEPTTITNKKALASAVKKAVTPPKKIKAFLNDDFTESKKLRAHLLPLIESEAALTIGNFRLSQNQIIFLIEDEVYLTELSQPVENEVILKGALPFNVNHNINVNNKKTSEYAKLIHTLNVKHMKSIGDFNMLYHYYKDRPEANEQSQIKYALNAGIYTKEIIQRALILISEKYLTLPQQDLTLIFRKLYRVLGTDACMENIANKLASSIRKQTFPVPFIMLLAAFFTESGEYEKAIEMAWRAKGKEDNAWSKHRYLALTYLLVENNLLKDEWAKNDKEIFLMLNKNEWEFENYINTHHSEISIIGNAPNEIGKNKGASIDSTAKVTRFNGAITEFPYSKDYGRKTNILVLNPRYYETQRNNKYNLDFIIISDGNVYSSKNLSLKLHDLYQFCDKICLLPRKLDISLTQKIEASPSSGLKYMEWIYSIKGEIPKKNVHGFSLVDQDHGVATSYSKGRRVGLNTIHNWSNEQKHMDKLISKNNEMSA